MDRGLDGCEVRSRSVLSVVVVSARKDTFTDSANAGALLVFALTLIGILAGADAGRRKAFMLKLQAQHNSLPAANGNKHPEVATL
jgi:hypothetical protein